MELLFNLDEGSTLAARVASTVGCTLAAHEDRCFEDGEHKLRPLQDPCGAHVAVVASLAGDVQASPQDKLVRLLLLVSALKDHGARRIVAVIPYLAYARKDERTQPWDPLSLRVVAQVMEAVGIDHLIALEVHSAAAFDNALRCTHERIDGFKIFDPWVQDAMRADAHSALWTIASPDPGGVKRALRWRERLQSQTDLDLGFAMVDKRRSSGRLTSGLLVAGDVQGRQVILLDDLVASGSTAALAARALRLAGAQRIVFAATHAVLTPQAERHLGVADLDQVLFSDSVWPMRLPTHGALAQKVKVFSAAALLSDALRRAWSR